MHRFFVSPEQVKGDKIWIKGEDVKHLTKVLRVSDHELFEVCDGHGMDYHCRIIMREADQVVAHIEQAVPSAGENPYTMTLFQALPKGHKLEEIIQKGTECGINEFIPFISTFCVAKIKDQKQAEKKRQRLLRVAYEAAKQSKRGVVPAVKPIMPFDAMIDIINHYDLAILAYEHESTLTLKTLLARRDLTMIHDIAIIVGPEGGFAPDEVAEMCEHGAISVSLGKRILRTETASAVIASQVNYAFE